MTGGEQFHLDGVTESVFGLEREVILFDTEFTCWEGSQERAWSGPNEYREIVEIGAVRVNGDTLEELAALDIIVKPKINPILSDYFIRLTAITKERVDAEGVPFAEAIGRFAAWCGERVLYCFGRDQDVLVENCALAGISFPLAGADFRNARDIFERHGVPPGKFSSGNILKAFGLEPRQRPHGALNDARGILDGFRELVRRAGPA